ncbi:MAG: competence/damage-inducible protein A [Candidatus Brocadiae bacterium]|nr:competence/damage-inducible protein A [Candidatus Brocadiia bacterium]
MKTIIISTGEELVRGRTIDTNAPFLAAHLEGHGFDVCRLVTVGDDPALLGEEIVRASQDCALIVISGGLGPTADDRTRRAIADAVGQELVEDGESRRHVEDRLRSFGRAPTQEHLSQALFPAGSTVFPNPQGTARGFACRRQETWVVAMPGVPAEMRPMFSESVLPFVVKMLAPPGHVRFEVVHIFPASESAVDERIADMTAHGRNPSVGITVRGGVISVSVCARSTDSDEADRLLRQDLDLLAERFGELAFGRGEATLATAVSELLRARGATIGVAESVTGGLIGHMLVDVPGISRFLLADVVAYGDRAKVEQLGVPAELIQAHGAVSPQVAESMARGICSVAGSDLGLSTTGIAGPTGGSEQKPVGLLYVGVCLDGAARVARLNLRGERRQIKDRAAKHALNMARLALLKGVDLLEPDRTI